jgi:hypothetical protein
VLSTPSMIALMERASIQAVQDYLPEGRTTVGFEVHVKQEPPQMARRDGARRADRGGCAQAAFKVEAWSLAMAPIGAQSLPFSARADRFQPRSSTSQCRMGLPRTRTS